MYKSKFPRTQAQYEKGCMHNALCYVRQAREPQFSDTEKTQKRATALRWLELADRDYRYV